VVISVRYIRMGADGMKVAIVGGSVAGLNAACELAQNSDAEITLYEEHPEIGKPVQCAEGYVDRDTVIGPPLTNSIDTTVKKMIIKLSSDGFSKIITIPKMTDFWVVDRVRYEQGLAKKCENLGVEILTNQKAKIKDLEVKNDYVIDASGYPSQTSIEYNFKRNYKKVGFAIQYTIKGDFTKYCNDKGESTVLFGLRGNRGLGYYWIFPKSQDVANVGIGWADRPAKISELEEIVKSEGVKGEVIRRTGGRLACEPLQQMVYNNVLLVGDAAGLVDPFWGEGIENAIISARVASKCIMNNSVGGYRRNVMKLIGHRLETGDHLRSLWYTLDFKTFAEFLSIAGEVPIEVLDNQSRMRIEMLKRPILMSKIGLCILKKKIEGQHGE